MLIERIRSFALPGIGFALMLGAALLGTAGQVLAEYPAFDPDREDIAAYVTTLVEEHDFEREELLALFTRAHRRQDIIERISRPAEKVWTWSRYRKHLVDEQRVAQGVEFWRAHAETLNRAAEKYGVGPAYVVAILGIETRYGRVTGSFPVLDALATLGFDYPPRASFFRKELTEFLLLAREEQKDPATLLGSYAGAMGYGQFIPSSYRHYAVDFNADGQRDIWHDAADAIGSVANYFSRHGWQGDAQVAVPVTLADGELDKLANQGLKPSRTVAQWRELGVLVDGAPAPADGMQAALFRFETDAGPPQYWLGLHDFYVITRYNHSHMYALAVHQLSRAISAQFQVESDER